MLLKPNDTELTSVAEVDVQRPAAQVWAILADYDRDPEWRRGVATMAPAPAGPVRPGTTTDERIRFAGRGYRNGGVVTDVEPGTRFTWRTTSGVAARGSRAVTELGPTRCRVRLERQIRPRGLERVLAPVLAPLLRRALTADAAALRGLAEAGPTR